MNQNTIKRKSLNVQMFNKQQQQKYENMQQQNKLKDYEKSNDNEQTFRFNVFSPINRIDSVLQAEHKIITGTLRWQLNWRIFLLVSSCFEVLGGDFGLCINLLPNQKHSKLIDQ